MRSSQTPRDKPDCLEITATGACCGNDYWKQQNWDCLARVLECMTPLPDSHATHCQLGPARGRDALKGQMLFDSALLTFPTQLQMKTKRNKRGSLEPELASIRGSVCPCEHYVRQLEIVSLASPIASKPLRWQSPRYSICRPRKI